jgi:hypothetical protein
VRWEQLFSDLEAQSNIADEADLAAETADRTRREAGEINLVDRLLPSVGQLVRVQVQGAGNVAGRLEHVSVDSLLVREAAGREVLLPLDAVLSLAGVTARSAAPGSQGRVFERLRLPSALRALARDRACLHVVLRDGATFTGTVDRVGRDFFEIAEHAATEPRRHDQVSGLRVIALAGVGAFFSC